MTEPQTQKKELAKLRRLATELAGAIHDVEEESLWQEYDRLPELSTQLVAAVEKAEAFRKDQGL